jgi:hypothetical protein
MRDLLAELRSLHVGGAEVDTAPDARVDDLLERVREAVERPSRAGAAADGAERDLVGAEEVLERVHDRAVAQLCAEGWSGNAGVESGGPSCCVAGSNSGVQFGSATVAGLPSVSAARIAAIGRQNCQWYLSS